MLDKSEETIFKTIYGWDYEVSIFDEVYSEINQFYLPKYYNNEKRFVEADNVKNLIYSSLPQYTFDVIECYVKFSNHDLQEHINTIFNLNQ